MWTFKSEDGEGVVELSTDEAQGIYGGGRFAYNPDDNDDDNDGETGTSVPQSFTITIQPVNDPPSARG